MNEEEFINQEPVYPLTDLGNGLRFAHYYRDMVKYNIDTGKWLHYIKLKGIWSADKGETKARIMAKNLLLNMYEKEKHKYSDEYLDALRTFTKKSQASPLISNMIKEGGQDMHTAMGESEFDKDPWLLNCLNGIVDLKTGDLKKHSPEHFLTKVVPANYKPGTTDSKMEKFLLDCCDNNLQKLNYLQKAVGYSLTGSTEEEVFFLLIGLAQTGKSTFTAAIKALFGDYGIVADFRSFLNKGAGDSNSKCEIAMTVGKRLVLSQEVDEGKKLAQGLVKSLTGGDTISARHLYRAPFNFVPQFKMWLIANHAPRVSDRDDAMWRRIRYVAFKHVVPEDERDNSLKKYLSNMGLCGDAWLAWAVEGCLKWQREGLQTPQCVLDETKGYKAAQNPISDFISERLEIGQGSDKTPVAQVWFTYVDWCKKNKTRFPLGKRSFNERLEALGAVRKQTVYNKKNLLCWHGVAMKRTGA